MKKPSMTDADVVAALTQWCKGGRVHRICDRFGISVATLYNLRKRFAGMDANSIKRIRDLEAEKFRLTKLVSVMEEETKILEEIYDRHLLGDVQTRSCSQFDSEHIAAPPAVQSSDPNDASLVI